MKIAIFTDTYLPQVNGVVTSINTFRDEFVKKGHKVVIIGPKISRDMESTEDIWYFRSVKYPFQPEHRIISPVSRHLAKFRAYQFDIIHAQTPFSLGYVAQILGKMLHIPLVHTYHTHFAEYVHHFPLLPTNMVKKFAIAESRRFCNRCDHIVTPSNQMKNQLLDYGIEKPIDVLPTGIKLDNTIPTDPINIRKRYSIDPDKKLLIFVGRTGSEKNIYFLMDSFKIIFERMPNTHLLVVGDGPERPEVEEYVQKSGLGSHVTFTGYLPYEQISQVFSQADVYLFPSVTETQGLTLLESLAVGTPAVCINEMGVKDVLGNEQGGFLCENNIEDYTSRAIQLLSDPVLYQRKRSEALSRVQHFSADRLTDDLLNIYEQLIYAFTSTATL